MLALLRRRASYSALGLLLLVSWGVYYFHISSCGSIRGCAPWSATWLGSLTVVSAASVVSIALGTIAGVIAAYAQPRTFFFVFNKTFWICVTAISVVVFFVLPKMI
jgi:hypothetical protein